MNTEQQQDLDRVKRACEDLSEHYDSVQIFATRHEPVEDNGTVNIAYGSGNWFSRYGVVKEWLVKQDERSRINARKDEEEE